MGKAIFKQRSGVLGVGIVAKCGLITVEQLLGLGNLFTKIGSLGCKLSTRQTLVVLIPEEKLDQLASGLEEIGLQIGVFGNTVRNVKGCPGGTDMCPRSCGNAHSLGVEIQDKYMNQPAPHDFKISVAGCHRSCTDPYCADFGVITRAANKYDVYIGGRGGSRRPIHGQLILSEITKEAVFETLDYVLAKYRELGENDERLCLVIERLGLQHFVPEIKIEQVIPEIDEDFANFLGA